MRILSINCLPNNPSNSIPFQGQNALTPNSWTGQPVQSFRQGMTNIFDVMNPNPSQNTYANNNDYQQTIKYDQQYPTSQPFNPPLYNHNQQYSTPQQYNEPPYKYEQQFSEPSAYNTLTHNYEKQSSMIQPYNSPQVSQKNQNQHSTEPQLYNLHPQSQSSGQKNSQSFGTIGPFQKEYQKKLPSSINQPIERLPDFGQPINNAKNQHIIPQSSLPIPSISNQSQSSQMPSKLSKPIVKDSSKSNGYNIDIKEAELPDFGQPIINPKNQDIIPQSSPQIPSIPNQSQLSQMPSKLSKPIVKSSSISNGYNIDNKEVEVPDFGQPINNAKNQDITPQSSPPTPSIFKELQLSHMPLKFSKPIVNDSTKSNGYNIDNKEAEVPDFGQHINNAKNQDIIPQSSPQIPSIPNQSQLSQIPSKLSKPIVKSSSISNGYNIDIKEAELPDFGQPIINPKIQDIIPQSSLPIPSISNQSQSSQMPSKLSKPIVKSSSISNGYNIDNKEAEVPDFGQPINNAKNQDIIPQSSLPIPSILNQSESSQMPSKLSKPIVKDSSKSNGYNIDNKEAEVPDFGQHINNAKNQDIIPQSSPQIPSNPNQSQLSQMPSKLSKPIVKSSSISNRYNIDIKEAELPDFGQPIINPKNQDIIPQSSLPIPSISNQSQSSQMPSKLSKPIVKDSSKSNGYNIDNKEADVPDFGQPKNNAENQENIQQSSPPIPSIPNQSQLSQMPSKLSKPIVKSSSISNGYNIDIKEAELPDFGQPIINPKNQDIIPQSSLPIPSISNQSQSSQMPSKLSKPIVKDSSKSNGYNIDNKEAEVPDFGQPKNNAENQENIQQSSPPIPSIQNQSQSELSKPIVKSSSISNGYNIDIKEAELPDFGQPIINPKNQDIIPQSSLPIPSISNQSQSSQMPSKLSKPIVKDSSKSNGYNIDNKEAEVPDFGQPKNNAENQENIQQSSPPIPSIQNQSQSELSKPIVKSSSISNGYNIDIKEAELPDFGQHIINPKNQDIIPQSSLPIPSISNQSQSSQMPSKLSKPIVKSSSISNGYNIDIKEAELPDFGQSIINSKNQDIIPQSSLPIPSISNQSQSSQMPSKFSKPIVNDSTKSNGYNIDNKEAELPDFGQPIINLKNQYIIPQSFPLISPIPNQFQPSKPIVKGTLTPNDDTMPITNDNMSLNSLLGLPNSQSGPLINDFVQNEDFLINNSQTDIQSFLNSENVDILNPSNNVLENLDDSQLVFNDVLSQLPMNVQSENVIIDPQSNDLTSNMDLNDDTENLQNTSNEDSLPADFDDTELNEESKLENAMSESSVFALDDNDTENDKQHSLENLVFGVPPPELDGLSNYDCSYIIDTENPKNAKDDNDKITVYANPNDVHILQLSPKQSSTNDNSYLINNNLLNTPSTGMPLWYSSFPNGADYVQQFNSNNNKQLPNSLFNFNQNPAYNQIPMYLENSNYYNQQAAVDQNQMTSKTQSPGLSLDDYQPNSMDNSGSIYKKVDLKNPPPNSSNSWSLLKKDYTKNLRPNQNDRYTSGDGTTRTSFFGTPLSSYQNSNQGILNLPLNDMFVQNMISVISTSVEAPLDGTKAIFDVTRANFPRSSVSHIIRITHAIVRSVMQTLNKLMKTLYGRRVKRDFNPFEVLHNLPGALVNKYSLQSTAAPTTKNINSQYYNQPTTADQTIAALFTGQQPTADYFISQPATENMLGQQQTYGNEIDRNYYGSQDDNIGMVSQPLSTQNYVLNSLVDAIISAVRSNVPAPYSIDSPEVKQYTQQVIVTAEIVFKNQIDNIIHGQSPTLNMY